MSTIVAPTRKRPSASRQERTSTCGGDLVRLARPRRPARAGRRAASRPPAARRRPGRRRRRWRRSAGRRRGRSAEKQCGGRVALEAVDEPPLAAPADREQRAQHPAQLDQSPSSGTITAAMPGRSGSGPTPTRSSRRSTVPPASSTAQRRTRCSLRTASSPPPSRALLRRDLEGGPAGPDDAAQRPRVDLHRQQLVVGGLADPHVAARQRRAGAQVEADRGQPQRRQGGDADLHRQRAGPQHQRRG